MRIFLTILFIGILSSDAQIINASKAYIPLVSSEVLLLDSISGANAAFSLRKVRTAYTGNCIRVRRKSDNTESDIGFVANVLDTTSLKNFVGTNSTDTGYVVTWYDQSGNARDITQSVAGSQPFIILSGAINRMTQPAIKFNSKTLSRTDAIGMSGTDLAMSAVTIFRSNNTTTNLFYWSLGWSSGNNPIFGFNQQTGGSPSSVRYTIYKRDNSNGIVTLPSLAVNTSNRYLHEMYHTGTATTDYLNNAIQNNAASQNVGTLTLDRFGIGGLIRSSAGNLSNIDCQEIIIWQSDKLSNQSYIANNINTYYSIY